MFESGVMLSTDRWPKRVPVLSPQQEEAREKFMMLWHQQLPSRYWFIEKFNHGYVAGLPVRPGSKTLEIGAGIGGHLEFENLAIQEYHCLEYRENFCDELRKILPVSQVHQGNIEVRQPWQD